MTDYSELYDNGLYAIHNEELAEFFERLDENGGWPEGKTVCYEFLDMRKPVEEVSFRASNDGMNIMGRKVHSTLDQYVEYTRGRQ